MAVISLNGVDYFSYATVVEADQVLFPQPNTENWFLLTDEAKGRNLVAASNWLDSLPWKDECSPQSVREGKAGVVNAAIFLANAIANGDTAFLGGTIAEPGTKKLVAGSASIEYFFSFTAFNSNPNNPLSGLPPYIRSLIIGCIAGTNNSGIGGSIAFGTNYKSDANEPWDFSK